MKHSDIAEDRFVVNLFLGLILGYSGFELVIDPFSGIFKVFVGVIIMAYAIYRIVIYLVPLIKRKSL